MDLHYRITIASKYISLLSISLSKPWVNQYSDFKKGKLYEIEKLTLIHPNHLDNLDFPVYMTKENIREQIQGKRSFPNQTGDCRCELIWGYPCGIDNSKICGDHLFPFSLGGPTISTNKILLCSYHNMVKTCDIHLFPWEDIANRSTWLDAQIEKTNQIMRLY